MSRGVRRGRLAGAGAGRGRGRVRRCWSGMPQRESLGTDMVEPRGSVHEPAAKRAGGGMPDDAFWGKSLQLEIDHPFLK